MGKKFGWVAGKLITAISAILAEIFVYLLSTTQLLPSKYMLATGVVLAAVVILVGALTWNVTSKARYFLGWLLALLFAGMMAVGCQYILRTNETTDRMTSSRTETTEVGVYVRADDTNDFSTVAASYTYGILGVLDRESTDLALAHLDDQLGTAVATQEYGTITEVVDALLDGSTQAMILNKAYLDILEDIDGYEDIMTLIREATLVVSEKEIVVEESEPVTTENTSVQTTECFSVYLSGIDTYGSISTKSRSDVNIIATINPNTHQILLVNTPRDYFVPLSISDGQEDKLTHAGIYGIQVSMDTLEMLYDVQIDYYFRVNFTGFKAIIDALGGITVESDYAFSTDDGYDYVKGSNTLNGAAALSFARERHAFEDGDNQRGKDQMAVIKGVINKVLSTEMLLNYTSVLDAVDGSFETSMPYDLLSTLVRNQLNDGSSWEVITYSATGENGSAIPYSMSQKAYVMIPDQDSVETVKELFAAIHDDQILTQP